jgi:hypothetical protein
MQKVWHTFYFVKRVVFLTRILQYLQARWSTVANIAKMRDFVTC